MTTGALSTISINNSGTSTLTGAVSCGAITSTGNFSNGTNAMTTGALSTTSINSSGTITGTSETLTATLNQLVLGTTKTTTISANPPAASRTYTIPDVFTTAATEFVMSQGIQTIPGAKTFSLVTCH